MARKILLADDSVTAQNMGRKILADAGYEVVTVNNGSAALKKVNEVKPDAIVLDVYMPGYSGLEVCQRLKEVNETARIPILLTVGKLEPFKPEEAKRARADAFIVKPFEASELLSALSKLEDKIVPRPEANKPGRFARAIAAVEEGRYDKSMAVEEDTSWKSRIAFPSAKKEKPAEEEYADDPGFYNPVNKDLRTLVDHPPAHRPEPVKHEAPHVDLGALAAHGLPKDVTPEEIAALAAAAAQMKGTAAAVKHEAESRVAESKPTEERTTLGETPGQTMESRVEETRPAETHLPEAEIKPPQVVAQEPEPEPQPPVVVRSVVTPAEITVQEAIAESKVETKEQPAAEIPQEAAVAPTAEVVAEKVPEEKQEAKAEAEADEKSGDMEKEVPSFALAPAPEEMAASAPVPFPAAYADSGNGLGTGSHAPTDEPMTMAAAAGAEFTSTASRWMAVPVAVLPGEASLSLEQEMQKTYAALAAAETAPAVAPEVMAQSQPAAVAELPVESPAAEPAPVSPTFLSGVAETVSSVASKAAEAIKAVVKEFETVAAKEPEIEAVPPVEAQAPVPVRAAEPVAQAAAEFSPAVEAKKEEEPVAESVAAEKESGPAVAPEATGAPPLTEPAAPEPKLEQGQKEEQKQKGEQEAEKQEEPQPVIEAAEAGAAAISPIVQETETAPVAAIDLAAEPALASQVSPQATAEVTEQAEPSSGGIDEMAKKEQEIAANTAAAWASWRRIRETGPKGRPAAEPAGKEAEEAAAPKEKDEAAMAVAAGAEKAPEEVSAEGESAEIASIVDSVLADLRPKIVEEISKKLGKKK